MRYLPAGNENRRAFFYTYIYYMVLQIRWIACVLISVVWLLAGCNGKKSTVLLLKADNISEDAFAIVAQTLRDTLGFSVDTGSMHQLPDSLWSSNRKRYRAEKLLQFLKFNHPEHTGARVILVTDKDLGIVSGADSLRGANGLSYQNGNFAVISDYRLHQYLRPQDSVNYYLSKVALHEAGHMLGLNHCKSIGCIMEAVEAKQHITTLKGFCPQCRKKLSQM